jgi:hypothetical protein
MHHAGLESSQSSAKCKLQQNLLETNMTELSKFQIKCKNSTFRIKIVTSHKYHQYNITVKVIYSPDIPNSLADFTQVTPWYWNSIYYGLISLRRKQRCAAATAIYTV